MMTIERTGHYWIATKDDETGRGLTAAGREIDFTSWFVPPDAVMLVLDNTVTAIIDDDLEFLWKC